MCEASASLWCVCVCVCVCACVRACAVLMSCHPRVPYSTRAYGLRCLELCIWSVRFGALQRLPFITHLTPPSIPTRRRLRSQSCSGSIHLFCSALFSTLLFWSRPRPRSPRVNCEWWRREFVLARQFRAFVATKTPQGGREAAREAGSEACRGASWEGG